MNQYLGQSGSLLVTVFQFDKLNTILYCSRKNSRESGIDIYIILCSLFKFIIAFDDKTKKNIKILIFLKLIHHIRSMIIIIE